MLIAVHWLASRGLSPCRGCHRKTIRSNDQKRLGLDQLLSDTLPVFGRNSIALQKPSRFSALPEISHALLQLALQVAPQAARGGGRYTRPIVKRGKTASRGWIGADRAIAFL